jgi:hypothetical protein
MFVCGLLIALYFLPTIVAAHHGHRLGGVLLLNLLFGWTGIGWAALLLWALLSPRRFYVQAAMPFPGDYRYARCGMPPRF